MYNVGDTVVYPAHGAGKIEAIEEVKMSDAVSRYYIMRIPFGDMKVLIPVDGAEKIGVRDVIEQKTADEVIEFFRETEDGETANWNKRFRENMSKVKSGNIFEVAGVVKSLMLRDTKKGLSTSERKMLANAKQIMVSELVIAKGITFQYVDNLLKQIVNDEQSRPAEAN
ncbi:MAG: CarD family transcriptional regulator [Clostridia bacterium]|nr:CarD family transcriptional regulator [Clostridia bacterium]